MAVRLLSRRLGSQPLVGKVDREPLAEKRRFGLTDLAAQHLFAPLLEVNPYRLEGIGVEFDVVDGNPFAFAIP